MMPALVDKKKNELETAVVFGHWNNLVGVCTRPSEAGNNQTSPGVLMLTPGMLHHVGPFRLHVKLARRLSKLGFRSLRFCLSGIGESLGVGAEGESTTRATDEVRQAMDWMETHENVSQFVLFGLCSGADDAVHAALADERVRGLVLMDGCGFRTKRYHLRKWLCHKPRKLLHRLIGLKDGGSIIHGKSDAKHTLPVGDDIREFSDRMQAEKELESLLVRGVKLMFLYTGGVDEYYNGRSQFREMFPNLGRQPSITVRYFPELDHVARLAEDRMLVVDEVSGWIEKNLVGG
jgi:hypothetical protein